MKYGLRKCYEGHGQKHRSMYISIFAKSKFSEHQGEKNGVYIA